ncbi:MAG: hypothetical protein Salg2KO_11600 [Salibacteraceae bacterium]
MKNLSLVFVAATALVFASCNKTPTASFTADNTSPGVGEVVKFTDGSTDAFNHVWDFGDGSSSNAVNPTHVYMMAGTYDVVLQVEDKNGKEIITSSATSIVVSEVLPAAPSVSFDASGTNVLPGQIITFENTSENAYDFRWDFGNGDESRIESPTHRYYEPGTYTVTLQATDSEGGQVTTTTSTITVSLSNADAKDAEQMAAEEALADQLLYVWNFANEDFEYSEENYYNDYDNDYDRDYDFHSNGEVFVTDNEASENGGNLHWTTNWSHVVDNFMMLDGYIWEVEFTGGDMILTRKTFPYDYNLNEYIELTITRTYE